MKYIIEIEDEPFMQNNDPVMPTGTNDLYRAKGFNSLVFDKNELDKLTPYTEPDRKAIELQHSKDILEVARMNYYKGAEDGWEFAKQVSIMKPEDKEECWGTAKGNTINLGYHYKEAKATYDKWKKDRDEIKAGDEVAYTYCNQTVKFVVMDIVGNRACGFKYPCDYDECGEYCDLDDLRKTGRHFPQIVELLKAMKEEEK